MSALLQPEDSKRVADEIIKAIKDGHLDIADALAGQLSPGTVSFGVMLVEEIGQQISKGIDRMPAPS